MEQQNTAILQDAGNEEKSAYLATIASIATADREATEEEIAYIDALCDAAELPQEYKDQVLAEAADASGNNLQQHLTVLKGSELRYSLVTDLITFAQSDQNYSEEEQQHVQQIAQYLGVDNQQFSLLKQYSEEAVASGAPAEEVASPAFLSQTGLQPKMQAAGINTGGLLKGLLGFAGPMILASMLRRKTGGLGGALGGGLGGALGGVLGGGGGLGGMLGGGGLGGMLGGSGSSGGGLGSLIGMLSGGRGMRGAGGLLGRLTGGRF